MTRWMWEGWRARLGGFVALGVIATLVGYGRPHIAWAATTCDQGSSVYVVAHEDDSILFQDPALQEDFDSGRCVETIFVTAGDDGQGSSYWRGREAGAEASYAEMAGVSDVWTQTDAGVSGHPMPRLTLAGKPTVSLVFTRLPDGNNDGSGFSSNGFESLQKLWQGTISTIEAVDGSSSYTKSDLTDTLSGLFQAAGADRIVTQDFVGAYGDGDHSDHHSTAYFAQAAGAEDPTPHTLTGYLDYPISSLPANLSAADTQAKEATWFAYAPFDPSVCQTASSCEANGDASWWSREYISSTVQQPSGSGGANVAPLAAVTASSENASTGQLAVKAVDGSADGYPGDYTHEWATLGEGAGAWLNLAWSSPQALTSITLFDRPNPDDQITGGTVTFSDGSSLAVGVLPNDGSPLTLTFAAKTVTSLKLTITSVSSTTQNIGLAEIQAFTGSGSPPSGSLTLSGPASLTAGDSVQLGVQASSGSPFVTLGSDSSGGGFSISSSGPWSATLSLPTSGGGASFYYRDTRAGKAIVTASATAYTNGTQSETVSAGPLASIDVTPAGPVTIPVGETQAFGASGVDSFGNPVTISPAWSSTLGSFAPTSGPSTSFTATSAGSGTVQATVGSISGLASITVSAASVNVAPLAAVTASSENASTGQLAVKAVDGSADGYPGDYTHEWATLGEGAGAWLNLAWSSPQALTSITLFDRPNPDDQITGGTVTFSDGSSLAVGVLPNDGSPLTLTFAAKTVTSLKLTITSVSSTTQNIGLAEIQAFTGSGSPPSGSLTLSGPASLTAGDSVQLGVQANSGSPFVTLGSDSSGGGFSISSSGPWSATLSLPTSGGGASFYYRDTRAGKAIVTASATAYTNGTQSETVSAGPLASIDVTPAGPATIPVGETQAFGASGVDSFGNPVTISPAWSSTLGSFAPTSGPSTSFTATSAGSGTVQATVGSISGLASITVSAASVNVAPLAAVTASSENASTGQLAVKAVDGSADGYPGDYTHEWATLGEGAGAWLNLAWSSPQALTSITLFDRPNPDDQITGGTVTFSDGSSLAVGVLPNDGSPLTLTFAAKTVTSLKLTITSVSSTTQNIGLAEIQTDA